MAKTVEHAALLGLTGRDRGFAAALEAVVGELGFATPPTPATGGGRWPRTTSDLAPLEVALLAPEHRGAWACLGASPALARAITARIATRLATPLQVFTATARYDDRSLECAIEDHVIRPDGRRAAGTFARELEARVHGNWKELCDTKSHFAAGALVDAAAEAWLGDTATTRTDLAYAPPASLGDRRLDELALRIRVAVRAELTTLEGRICIRVVTADNANTTSFLTEDELARLQPAVAVLLVTTTAV